LETTNNLARARANFQSNIDGSNWLWREEKERLRKETLTSSHSKEIIATNALAYSTGAAIEARHCLTSVVPAGWCRSRA